MTVVERIEEAIGSGEVLQVRYHGGSQPGALREIAPITISGDKIRARCYSSNAVKSYVIRKLEIVDAAPADFDHWESGKEAAVRYADLESFWRAHADELIALGWHAQHGDDVISLHRWFKNGRPLKGSDLALSYEEFTTDAYVDLDGELCESKRKRARPWGVAGRAFGSLDKAASVFLKQARELAVQLGLAPKEET